MGGSWGGGQLGKTSSNWCCPSTGLLVPGDGPGYLETLPAVVSRGAGAMHRVRLSRLPSAVNPHFQLRALLARSFQIGVSRGPPILLFCLFVYLLVLRLSVR